jgi:hypothetical protein
VSTKLPVTTTRAAEIIGCAESTVRAAIERGELLTVEVAEGAGGVVEHRVDQGSLRSWKPKKAGRPKLSQKKRKLS